MLDGFGCKLALKSLFWLIVLSLSVPVNDASTILGAWTPLFKGIDHAVGTNTPGGGGFATLQVVHAVRVDLTDPDIQLFTTPRVANYAVNSRETGGLKVRDFLTTHQVQLAINANFFDPSDYYLPAGTPMDVSGLLISQGTVVSAQEGSGHSAAVLFTTNNQASIVPTNWPAISSSGIYTAVSGEYPILIGGVNVGLRYRGNSDVIHQLQPRTAFGLSQDRHTLFLLTIDGRQPGYSDGSLDWETAAWMLLMGASDAVNMDGGGSTTLVMADPTGNPIDLNHSNAIADSGRERTVGAHFGIYAQPVPGFINAVDATPDDTSATITWTTTAPSSSQVQYGPTTDLGSATMPDPRLVTDHTALLTGLTPSTTYYFLVESDIGTETHQSPTFAFTTTNYVTTNFVFDVTNAWKFTAQNLDNQPWTTPGYDDSAWSGPGPGLLWIDVRATPDAALQPKGAQLPANPANSGYPYVTYYFRTHFSFTNAIAGASLLFSSYIDDGAAFYLNGHEIYRLNLPDAPAPVYNNTLANGYNCGGDATCAIDFAIAGDLVTNLVTGDNVLAVEVHNYNLLSPDITFGTTLETTQPYDRRPQLGIAAAVGIATITWSQNGFMLQQADSAAGPWVNVPGSAVTSPFQLPIVGAARYFRLAK
jgi:exopolysaccharide biosynthesis protein